MMDASLRAPGAPDDSGDSDEDLFAAGAVWKWCYNYFIFCRAFLGEIFCWLGETYSLRAKHLLLHIPGKSKL